MADMGASVLARLKSKATETGRSNQLCLQLFAKKNSFDGWNVPDMEKVMSYGVMSMPAFVVNEKVVSAGRVLKASEIAKMF